MKPDYAETGIPKSEYDMRRNSSNIVKPLLSETIEKMRTVCRVIIVFFYGTDLYCSWEEKY